jgi:hypothetical protein
LSPVAVLNRLPEKAQEESKKYGIFCHKYFADGVLVLERPNTTD